MMIKADILEDPKELAKAYDIHSIADSANDATGIVCGCDDFVALFLHGVVVLATFHLGGCKSAADFKTFGCRNAEHGLGQAGLSFPLAMSLSPNPLLARGGPGRPRRTK